MALLQRSDVERALAIWHQRQQVGARHQGQGNGWCLDGFFFNICKTSLDQVNLRIPTYIETKHFFKKTFLDETVGLAYSDIFWRCVWCLRANCDLLCRGFSRQIQPPVPQHWSQWVGQLQGENFWVCSWGATNYCVVDVEEWCEDARSFYV